MQTKLNGRHLSELRALSYQPGLWRGVEPHNSDRDLALYLAMGLIRHNGIGLGYTITNAGRAALAGRKP